MIRKFRKKPVVIRAVYFDGTNFEEIQKFVGRREVDRTLREKFDHVSNWWPDNDWRGTQITAVIWDFLHETWVGVKPTQWIIEGVQGEHYPCDADVFANTYEEVND